MSHFQKKSNKFKTSSRLFAVERNKTTVWWRYDLS